MLPAGWFSPATGATVANERIRPADRHARRAPARAVPERRQPAEGRGRQVAQRRGEVVHLRRADTRDRCRREEEIFALIDQLVARRGGAHDQLRAVGGGQSLRSRVRDARQTHRWRARAQRADRRQHSAAWRCTMADLSLPLSGFGCAAYRGRHTCCRAGRGLCCVQHGFANGANLANIGMQSPILLLLALPMTLIIMTEGIDLSMGAVLTLASVVLAAIAVKTGSVALALRWRAGARCRIRVRERGAGRVAGTAAVRHDARNPGDRLGAGAGDYRRAEHYRRGRRRGVLLFRQRSPVFPCRLLVGVAAHPFTHWLLYQTRFGPYVFALGGNRERIATRGRSRQCLSDRRLRVRWRDGRTRRAAADRAHERGAPNCCHRHGVRCDRRRGHRRDLIREGRRLAVRHGTRGTADRRAAQRPQPARGGVVAPSGRDRCAHHRGVAHRGFRGRL